MNRDNKIEDLVDRYFSSDTDVSNKSSILNEIKDKSNYSEDIEFERLLKAGFYSQEKEKVRAQIANIAMSKPQTISGGRTIKLRRYYRAAVALLLLLVCSVIVMKNLNEDITSGSNRLYTEALSDYNKEVIGKLSLRSNNQMDTLNANIVKALVLSEKGDNMGAKALLLEEIRNRENNKELLLLLSIQDYFLDNYNDILARENQLLAMENPNSQYEADYLLYRSYKALDKDTVQLNTLKQKIQSTPNHKYANYFIDK